MRRRHHQHQAGIAVIDHEGYQFLLLGGEVDAMVEIAGDDFGAAAEYRLQRIRAALEVDEFDGKTSFFILAELFRQHRRQVTEAGAAADRDRDFGLRRRRLESGNHGERHECERQVFKAQLHDFLPASLFLARKIEQWAGREKAGKGLTPSWPGCFPADTSFLPSQKLK